MSVSEYAIWTILVLTFFQFKFTEAITESTVEEQKYKLSTESLSPFKPKGHTIKGVGALSKADILSELKNKPKGLNLRHERGVKPNTTEDKFVEGYFGRSMYGQNGSNLESRKSGPGFSRKDRPKKVSQKRSNMFDAQLPPVYKLAPVESLSQKTKATSTKRIGGILHDSIHRSGNQFVGQDSGHQTSSIYQLLSRGSLWTSVLQEAPQQTQTWDNLQAIRCYADLISTRSHINQHWSRLMVDSSTNIRPGMMDFEVDFVGILDECLEAKVPQTQGFHPQYCVVSFDFEVPYPRPLRAHDLTGMSAGVCIPTTCQPADMKWIFSLFLRQAPMAGLKVDQIYCKTTEHPGPGFPAIVTMLCLALWGLVILTASILHVRYLKHTVWGRRPPPQQGASQRTPSSQTATSSQKPTSGRNRIRFAKRGFEHDDDDDEAGSVVSHVTGSSERDDAASIPESESGSSVRTTLSGKDREIRGILRGKPTTSIIHTMENSPPTDTRFSKIIRCLSLQENVEKLFDRSSSDTELRCLHGIRVLSLVWVVLVNTVIYEILFVRNIWRIFLEYRDKGWAYSLVGNGYLSLDSLFAVSGLLVGYSFDLRMDGGGRMNWGRYILHRYWRIVPTMVLVGVTYITLFPVFARGPLAKTEAVEQAPCLQWGWLNVLLAQNFGPNTCMSWTWFLAVDFQFFLFTPFVLILLKSRPRAAHVLVFSIVLASCVACGVLTFIYDLPVTQILLPDPHNLTVSFVRSGEFATFYFYKPWAHAGAFLLPLLVGFHLRSRMHRIAFSIPVTVAGWAVALSSMGAVLWAVGREVVMGSAASQGWVALYNGISRTVWGMGVCWVVVACSTGYGGPINSTFSWSGWKPLSRLSFVVYLIHPIVVFTVDACLDQLLYMTTPVIVYQFLGVWVCSLLLACVVTVTVEMPLTSLVTMVTCSGRSR